MRAIGSWQTSSKRIRDTGTAPDAPDPEQQRAVNRPTRDTQHPQDSRAGRRNKEKKRGR